MTAALLEAAPLKGRVSQASRARWLAELAPDRDLERDELHALAQRVGGDREAWLPLVREHSSSRHYVQLHRDPHLDIWLLCWTNQQETGLHDHDLSSGAVHVCVGDLLEERLELSESALQRVSLERREGETFDFDASHVHCIRHPVGRPLAVSIHVYSPALWRMGYYDVGEDGLLRRSSVSYAEEIAAG